MRSAYFGGILFIMLVATLAGAHAQTCAISTQYGLALDTDCDTVPDGLDNCKYMPNSDQRDMNRNGMGDACDAIIEETLLQPDSHVLPGEIAHLTLKIINTRNGPISDIRVSIEQRDLGIATSQKLESVPAGEATTLDFSLPTPKCAKAKDYPITITTSFVEPYTHEVNREDTTIRLVLEPRNEKDCTTGALDATVIDIFQNVDLDRGEDAIIPIKIQNLDVRQRTYHLAVNDLGSWGSWRIDPSADVTLAAGHETQVTLYVQTEQWTQLGTRELQLTVTSENRSAQIPVDVYVRGKSFGGGTDTLLIFKVIVVMLIMLVIGVLALLLLGKYNRRHEQKEMKQNASTKAQKKAMKPASKKKTTTVKVERVDGTKRETYY